jgi:hypothetical protein
VSLQLAQRIRSKVNSRSVDARPQLGGDRRHDLSRRRELGLVTHAALVSTSTAIVGLALSVWKDRIGLVSPLSRTSKSET